MKKNFGLKSWKNPFFRTCEIWWNFWKNREISHIAPGRSGKVRNRPKPIFFGVYDVSAVKMSHIPASYDHFWWFSISVKIDHFSWISQKLHIRWFSKSWHPRGKRLQSKEMMFLLIVFSRSLHSVPETVKFWVLGHIHG